MRHYNVKQDNPMYGKQHTEKSKKKMQLTSLGKKNGMWKGNDVGYIALHEWVKNHLPKPNLCQECDKVPPYDLANKGIYDRNLDNWEWLCRKCHMDKDGRLEKLKESNQKRMNGWWGKCKFCQKKIWITPYNERTNTRRYCSKSCSNKGR